MDSSERSSDKFVEVRSRIDSYDRDGPGRILPTDDVIRTARNIVDIAQDQDVPPYRVVLCEDSTISIWFRLGNRRAEVDSTDDGTIVLMLEGESEDDCSIREISDDDEGLRRAMREIMEFLGYSNRNSE